jgi:hypothetical protein
MGRVAHLSLQATIENRNWKNKELEEWRNDSPKPTSFPTDEEVEAFKRYEETIIRQTIMVAR